MPCCCRPGMPSRASTKCLGRCDLPKHRCLEKEDVKPGPVPKCMGWLYTAKDAPDFQLRCGWRPGHIFCPVLRRIEMHRCSKTGVCSACSSCARTCARPCPRPCGPRPCASRSCSRTFCSKRCASVCPSSTSCCKGPSSQPVIRIVRHNNQYQITTKPSNVTNAPSSAFPLKYVLNQDPNDNSKAKYSIEAKFNDYQFDYTSSQSSFVLDFSPPAAGCKNPCMLCPETISTTDVPKKAPDEINMKNSK